MTGEVALPRLKLFCYGYNLALLVLLQQFAVVSSPSDSTTSSSLICLPSFHLFKCMD